MEREVAALGVGSAEGEETFNAQHSTLNVQGDGQQDGAEGRPTPVTAEQLVTSLTIRYLMVVREWMQSPMPAERRWRQLRVILRDVLELQRGEHREQRLELDWERLEFARERFEEGKLADERRAMIGFLVAARQWPEVQEALTSAFRLFQERKEGKVAESEPIKVNQGEQFFKNESAQIRLVDCPPSSFPSPPGEGMTIGHHRYPDGLRADPAVGVRTEGNKAEFGPIKVDQGEINKKSMEAQDELVGCPTSRRNRQPQSACGAGKVCRSATDSTSDGFKTEGGIHESVWVHHDGAHGVTRPTHVSVGKNCHTISTTAGGARMDENLAKLKPIKVDQGDKFLKKEEVQDHLVDCPRSWRDSLPQSACGAGKVRPAPSGTDTAREDARPTNATSSHSIGYFDGRDKTRCATRYGFGWILGGWELTGLNRGEIFYPGRERKGVGNGRGGFAWCFAGDELPGEDWHSRVRKRCRRYRSATAVQNASGQAHGACAYLWNQGMTTPQSACCAGKVCRSATNSTNFTSSASFGILRATRFPLHSPALT